MPHKKKNLKYRDCSLHVFFGCSTGRPCDGRGGEELFSRENTAPLKAELQTEADEAEPKAAPAEESQEDAEAVPAEESRGDVAAASAFSII